MLEGGCRKSGGAGEKNDQHWFILAVLLSGWCLQSTSLHPILSHYLPAFTAAHRVSYRVINTSLRPHTASTLSSRRRLMTAKDRQCILSLVTAMLLSVHTYFTVDEKHIPTPREASSSVPFQTLHLKWYIKATCQKILCMIDVSNDSESYMFIFTPSFKIWKTGICLSQTQKNKKIKIKHQRNKGKNRSTASQRLCYWKHSVSRYVYISWWETSY